MKLESRKSKLENRTGPSSYYHPPLGVGMAGFLSHTTGGEVQVSGFGSVLTPDF